MNSLEAHGITNLSSLEMLGDGGTAKVYRVETLDGPAALKIAKSHKVESTLLEHEADVLAELDHPNIIAYRGRGTRQKGKKELPWILMDCADTSVVHDTPLPPGMTVAVARQAANGLSYLHTEANLVHGDIGHDNIMLKGNKVVIVDFGASKRLPGNKNAGKLDPGADVITYAYTAPEIWDGYPKSPASDVYSLAVTTIEMLTGQPLVDAMGRDGYDRAHSQRIHPPLEWFLGNNMTIEHELIEEGLRAGLAKDPADRPNAQDFGERLVMDLSRARAQKPRRHIT